MSFVATELRTVTREIIADAITPITAYLALGVPGASVLLESVEGHDRLSRFSFIGLDYLETQTFDEGPALLDRIRAFARRFRVSRDQPAPPIYGGGVVTIFAYDAVRSLERIGTRPPAELPIPDAYCVVPGTWIVFDHLSHRLSLIGLAGEGEEARVAERLRGYEARLLAQAASLPGPVRAKGELRCSLDREGYLERVARTKQLIRDGDVYQLQLGIRFSCEVDGTAFDMYRHIRTRNPSPYMFFIDAPFGSLFGASPEFLVRLAGRAASLRPLAGTRPRGADEAEDALIAAELLAHPKEIAEHIMLVDLGRNDLGTVARTGSVVVDQLMHIEYYSHVMHIVSNVRAEVRPEIDALDLFAASFPAGTVTGTPKIRAMQRIDELEPVARGFYAGSIAHLDFNGDMDSCITLRSVQYANGRAIWQASAGIVADSEPELEYREVLHKTAIVRSILGCPDPE